MLRTELSEECDIHELAAGLTGLWAANRIVLARPKFERSETVIALAEELARVPWIGEYPDVGSVITRLIKRGRADCEDLCAAWWNLLKRLMGENADVVALLTPGGHAKEFHAFLRVHGKTFDPSVRGSRVLTYETIGGMIPPPPHVYTDPRAVIIAA